jgi:hypothetical protein
MSYPGAKLVTVNDRTVTQLPAMRFADVARRLGAATHDAGLAVPAFRCPPRVPGADRTIRRYPGGAVVSVKLRDRPFADVVTDMVDGVLAANRVPEAEAHRMRAVLNDALVGGAGAAAEARAA